MRNNESGVAQERETAWWRFPIMWLVVGGPAVVVVASMLTLALALRYPDAVLEDRSQIIGAASKKDPAQTPAVKARNNAATGGR